MGYRSDVKYKLLFKTADLRQTFIAKATLDVADIPYSKEIIESFDLSHDPDTEYPYHIDVHFEDVKWYPGDEWVSVQHGWFDELADAEGCGFVYMRLGEDDDDTDSGYGGKGVHLWDYITLHRYTEFC